MIIISLKSSSIDPTKGAIISLGAIDLLDHKREYYREYRIESDRFEIEEDTVQEQGFDMESLYDAQKPTFEEVALEFISWVNASKCTILAGNNISFTIMALRKNFEVATIDWPWGFHNIDLHTLVFIRKWNKLEEIPLTENGESQIDFNDVLEYAKIDPVTSLGDCLEEAKITAECFYRLLFNKKVFKEFES